jgi:hypothetical protein
VILEKNVAKLPQPATEKQSKINEVHTASKKLINCCMEERRI